MKNKLRASEVQVLRNVIAENSMEEPTELMKIFKKICETKFLDTFKRKTWENNDFVKKLSSNFLTFYFPREVGHDVPRLYSTDFKSQIVISVRIISNFGPRL